MIKILAAIGFGSALMLAPALALADDAKPADAPKADATMAPAPMMHHHHHHHHHHMMKKIDAPMKPAADAPKT
jgi:Spy/CpxP family protein refolding chaperone